MCIESDEVRVVPLTKDLLESATEVHWSAFRGYTNVQLGRLYVRAFLFWFLDDTSAMALIAKQGERCVGYVVGAPLGYQRKLIPRTFVAAAFGALTHPWIILRAGFISGLAARALFLTQREAQAVEADDSNMISLVGIGVDPLQSRRGVGGALMAAFEAEARQRGFRRMRLSVHADNVAARLLYENHGWQPSGRCVGQNALYYWKWIE